MNASTRILTRPGLAILAAGACLFFVPIGGAGDIELNWWTFDDGGDMWTTGGDLELSGTIGQPDATPTLTGGNLELTGGFWAIPPASEPSPCPGDLDGDDDTDHSDLGILLSSWGIDDGGDLNGDGKTDHSDLGILLADWGCGT